MKRPRPDKPNKLSFFWDRKQDQITLEAIGPITVMAVAAAAVAVILLYKHFS